MLIARAPMRISFGGGGTDLEAYYARYGGLVISTAINKYFYAVIATDESDDLQPPAWSLKRIGIGIWCVGLLLSPVPDA